MVEPTQTQDSSEHQEASPAFDLDLVIESSDNQQSLDQALQRQPPGKKTHDIVISKVPSLISSYFNLHKSFFLQYDPDHMGSQLSQMTKNPNQMERFIYSDVLPLEKRLLPYLESQQLPCLESNEGRDCLKRILNSFKYNGRTMDPFKDQATALCIEKYYLLRTNKPKKDGGITSLLLPDSDGNSQEDESCGCVVHPKKCPEYPPAFQKPVFNPCEYPHVLKLYSHFYEHCFDNRNLHAQAGAYYNQMNKHFVAPTLIISALSSIASFIASSEIVTSSWKTILSLSVGVMTSLNALVQSFSSAYQFDAKANSHFNAADKYDQLITEIDFEKSYPCDTEFFQQLEKKILDVKSSCQFLVPNYIKADYFRKREKANERNFIHNKIILPMKRELREAVVSGNLSEYKFADQAEDIQREIQRLQELEKNLAAAHKEREGGCCDSQKKAKSNEECNCCVAKGCKCCFPTCNKPDESLYEQNTFPSMS